LVACGSSDQGGKGTEVVATTGILADVARHVAGPDATVGQVIPNGASPHDFQLSAQGRQDLEQADLVLANGADLEAGIPLDDVDSPQWVLADHVDHLRPFSQDLPAGAEAGAEQESFPHDPHVWMDPTNVRAALPSLADALAEADPAHAADYRRRAREYGVRLGQLDRSLSRAVDSIPPADRKLVTSHDALGYFADRYGFDVVATAFPASGPEAEISASQLDAVEDAVRSSGVPIVFAQEEDDPEALERVAQDTGVGIEKGLVVESPGNTGGYIPMLRRDERLVAAGLGAGSG
jgi:ABC-type Zn uptake system ZnuABC Zn-binding protein ZnuA